MSNTLPTRPSGRHRHKFESLSDFQQTTELPARASKMATASTAVTEWRQQVGATIARAIKLAGLSQKEAWVLLGHCDGSQLNRWIKGTERPQFDALFAVKALRQPLVIAFCELAGAGVDIKTTIEIRRTA